MPDASTLDLTSAQAILLNPRAFHSLLSAGTTFDTFLHSIIASVNIRTVSTYACTGNNGPISVLKVIFTNLGRTLSAGGISASLFKGVL